MSSTADLYLKGTRIHFNPALGQSSKQNRCPAGGKLPIPIEINCYFRKVWIAGDQQHAPYDIAAALMHQTHS